MSLGTPFGHLAQPEELNQSSPQPVNTCYHCGDTCQQEDIVAEDKHFCCQGCKLVYEMLAENDLCTYYDLESNPGITLKGRKNDEAFAYLDHADIEASLLDFKDGNHARVSFYLPQIHCSSCIWLLENLYRLREGITYSQVDFLKKEIHLTYDPGVLSLRQVVNLLASIGYEPEINLNDLEGHKPKRNSRGFYYKLGVAGFAFGNIMLMSFPEYLGLEADQFPEFRQFFGYLNLGLSLPVLLYSSTIFFRSAYHGLKEKFLNIDVPISLGILALFLRSAFEILTHTGAGYMDSLAGLVFFLLIGRWFQNKTYDRISFDRDYKSYFPISTTRKVAGREQSMPITELTAGDTILVRNQELIPADSLLLSDSADIDYSFVTGESDPVRKHAGDLIYAGGRQIGPAIELTLVKNVSQSYLTQLWNHTAFANKQDSTIGAMVDRLGQRFTVGVLSIATVAGLYWLWSDSIGMAVNVFTAVLIVACPCALALSSPIILGNALRIMGRLGFYLKNTQVLERMSQVDHIVFDKTGTLTHKGEQTQARFVGELDAFQQELVSTLVRQSTHPVSRAIERWLTVKSTMPVVGFEERPGQGLQGEVDGRCLRLGRWAFVTEGSNPPAPVDTKGTWLSIDGKVIGRFELPHHYRQGLREVMSALKRWAGLSLISGDNDQEKQSLLNYLPEQTPMRFNQRPADKLQYIDDLQQQGHQVMMVGDGLNDAGALRLSDVGIAVSENIDTFSPACDGILDARRFEQFDQLMGYSRLSIRLVWGGLALSLGYNVVGLSIAVQGLLSPIVAAILMPLSSITVVVYGMLATEWGGRRLNR